MPKKKVGSRIYVSTGNSESNESEVRIGNQNIYGIDIWVSVLYYMLWFITIIHLDLGIAKVILDYWIRTSKITPNQISICFT